MRYVPCLSVRTSLPAFVSVIVKPGPSAAVRRVGVVFASLDTARTKAVVAARAKAPSFLNCVMVISSLGLAVEETSRR